ncbi:MAG: undecaprenyl-phosphate glucose phosphotransferase [Halobacteriovoraceae bacterium]|nr:undecaprenyl-phosphate glucose phosphotransferase [Halobacteriovoraceae bacterium]
MLQEHRNSFAIGQKLLDAILVFIAWMIAYYVRFHVMKGGQPGLEMEFVKIGPFLVLISLYAFYKNDLYRSLRFANRYKEIFSVIRGNFMATIGLVILLYFVSDEKISRLTILIYLAVSSFLLIIARILVRNFLRILRTKGKNLRHVLLIGNSPLLADYIHTARTYKDSGIRFMGWIDSDGLAKNEEIPEIEVDYRAFRESAAPDSIIISYSGNNSVKAHEFIANNYNDVIPIQLLPDLTYSLVGHQIEDFGGIPLLAVNQPKLNPVEIFVKRVIDFFGATIGSILISPILLFLTLGVKLSSPGPILFGQKRIGHDGKEFMMWKFRSMKIATGDEDKTEWSNKENPRKTKFGEFIRKYSLDELPQLLNVIFGDMSLVGPRPEQPYFVEKFRDQIPGYMLKHKMKPGMTGWAQVNGWRGDTDLTKRIECDIYYIKNWSLWFDIKILFLTIFRGDGFKNAY